MQRRRSSSTISVCWFASQLATAHRSELCAWSASSLAEPQCSPSNACPLSFPPVAPQGEHGVTLRCITTRVFRVFPAWAQFVLPMTMMLKQKSTHVGDLIAPSPLLAHLLIAGEYKMSLCYALCHFCKQYHTSHMIPANAHLKFTAKVPCVGCY